MITMEIDPQRIAFEQSQRDQQLSSRCLLAVFAYLGVPESLYDVGCGDGHLVRLARKLGTNACGVDLHATNTDYIYVADLTKVRPIVPSEIVICWELAEHLPESNADDLVDMLIRSTSNHLLFTAATSGQGGSGHINEQPHDYWRDKLVEKGLKYDHKLTPRLRRVFRHVAPGAWWYGANLQCFYKEN